MTRQNPDHDPVASMFDDATQVTSGDAELDAVFDAAMQPPEAEVPAEPREPRPGTLPYGGSRATPQPYADPRATPQPPADQRAPQPYASRATPQPFADPRVPTPQPFADPRVPTPQPFADPRMSTPQPFPPVRMTPQPFADPRGPAPSQDAAMNARLQRLAGLSLDRGPTPSVPSSRSPRRWVAIVPWVLLVVVIGGGGYYHITTVQRLKDAAATQAPAATAPTTTKPKGPESLLASGYVAAKTPIVLSATTAGRLAEVTVDAGDTIKKGQVLAAISDGALQAELSLTGAKLRDASRQMSRMQKLVAAQAATPADLERAVGAVEVAQAEMHVTQQKIDETRIRSPINGTVLEVLAHPGEAITLGPNQSAGILRIADLSLLIAEVDVAEAELKNVHVGQAAELTTESQRGHTFRGVVREIAEQADRARGTVQVKVDILPDPTSVDSTAAGSGSAEGSATPPTKPVPDPKKKLPSRTAKPPAKPAPTPAAKDTPKDTPKEKEDMLKPGMAVQVHFLVEPPPSSP